MKRWQNWSGTVSATPQQFSQPETEPAIQSLVSTATENGDTVRVAGSGHSFTPVVPSNDQLLSLERYTGVVDVDRNSMEVTVKAGTTLSMLNSDLRERGLALANLGDIDHQTAAGAFSTGTHGTGLQFGVLANQITAIRLVTADGTVEWIQPDEEQRFRAAQVSLGALGVITAYKINVQPAYDLCLRRHRLPVSEVLDNIEQFHEDHRSWEFFWFPHTDTAIVKTFDEVPPGTSPASTDGAIAETLDSVGTRVENAVWEGICQLGTRFPQTARTGTRLISRTLSEKAAVGPSHEILANDREVRFREMEYGLPAAVVPTVFRELRSYIEESTLPVQFPIECRFVGADEPYLSPAYGRDTGFIAVHAYYKKDLSNYFEFCERLFSENSGRPHWGKEHTKTTEYLANSYPEWESFQTVRNDCDPNGIFTNSYLSEIFGTA
ncbi:D-arabinono-1,4-lactone oxidase [Halovenus rubra]|uniref:D-arabinono-1,4-lactone oxidase n=2 Tax=Halovenus rubra TaxID=869890 RepID=A0ABD5X1L8_9EURY|nr:D-arabinono-1,4-lactone oxidase [Halovenus rubra]